MQLSTLPQTTHAPSSGIRGRDGECGERRASQAGVDISPLLHHLAYYLLHTGPAPRHQSTFDAVDGRAVTRAFVRDMGKLLGGANAPATRQSGAEASHLRDATIARRAQLSKRLVYIRQVPRIGIVYDARPWRCDKVLRFTALRSPVACRYNLQRASNAHEQSSC